MPSDANGVYSLPAGYLAVTGETVLAAQHNAPLEDVASGLSARLMRSGVAAMTGPHKLSDGTSSLPALTFASDTSIGFYKTSAGFGANGFISGVPIGGVMDFAGLAAPAGWLLCGGQSLLRADYPALFAVLGTFYGAADATHFYIPDYRGEVLAGRTDMATGDRGNLSGGGTIGAHLGGQSVTISQSNLPNYTLPNTLGWAQDTGTSNRFGSSSSGGVAVNNSPAVQAVPTIAEVSLSQTITVTGHLTGTVTSGGGGTSTSIVQPTGIANKIIFTGV